MALMVAFFGSATLVLIITVNGFCVPAGDVTFNFAPHILFCFNIDSNGNAKPDQVLVP